LLSALFNLLIVKLFMGVDAKRILLINELADYLKISTSTLYQWAQEGKLPRRKLSITSRTIRMSLVSG